MLHFQPSAKAWAVIAIVTISSWQGTGYSGAAEKAAASPQQREGTAGRKAPKKILYFEGAPRPEMKFITRAITDVPTMRLVVLQRTTDGKYLRIGVDNPAELQNGFPSTREELFKYEGMILGSAAANLFTPEQQRIIADFVTVRGGGLLALGGEQSFGEGGWLETPLSYLLPIAFDPNRTGQSPKLSLKVSARPTDQGVNHAALRIATDEHTAASLWALLPPVTIVNAIYPRAGADILLTGTDRDGNEQVVLAVQTHGAGKAMVFTPENSWLWQMNAKIDTPAHERFWRALLAWLVKDTLE
jgi:uncharacterized membrane protein